MVNWFAWEARNSVPSHDGLRPFVYARCVHVSVWIVKTTRVEVGALTVPTKPFNRLLTRILSRGPKHIR